MRLQEFLPAEGESSTRWMLHISSDMLDIWRKDFLSQIVAENNYTIRHLQQDFYIFESNSAVSSRDLLQTVFPRWICPVIHQWPTSPHADVFVEKAAQGLLRKFGTSWEHLEILATSAKLKRVVTGLKGRIIQLKTQAPWQNVQETNQSSPVTTVHSKNVRPSTAKAKAINDQAHKQSGDGAIPPANHGSILAVLLDERGLFAGVAQSRMNLGSALTGGLGFLSQNNSKNAQERIQLPSRAGGKIREILALLNELKFNAANFQNWLELGAAPGGMTQHLLDWGVRITAVDLAEMSPKVLKNPKVRHLKIHAQEIESATGYNALLCDMNGPYQLAAQYVTNLAQTMASGSLVVFTLKLPNMTEARNAIVQVSTQFSNSNVTVVCVKHLFHNRQEVTLVAQRN